MKKGLVRIGGQEFISDEVIGGMRPPGMEDVEVVGVLRPCRPPDDHREFPSPSDYEQEVYIEGLGDLASAGIAHHKIIRNLPLFGEEELGFTSPERGYSAHQLQVFGDSELFFACYDVLTAHGWLSGARLSDEIVQQVAEIEGPEFVDKAKKKYAGNCHTFVGEVAAAHFVAPLSRLWYAANMLALYFVHQDDLRLGFLWAEYQAKMRYEPDAARGKRTTEAANAGGQSRARQRSKARSRVLAGMKRLTAAGHS